MEAERFVPEQLELTLKLRRMSIIDFANGIGLSRRTVGNYLSGSVEPPSDTQLLMAAALGVPRQFFYREPIESPNPEAVSFRSLARMKAVDRNCALAYGGIAAEFADWLDSRFVLPEANVPDLPEEIDPGIAAAYVRQAWGWGEKPIPNMVHLLEKHGIKVFSLAIPSPDVDAYSTWYGDRPFVFLNTLKTGERSRFDAAHELGHLVLHRHGQLHQRNAEQEANGFAAAFLMPKNSVIGAIRRNPSLATLISKKEHWGVSVAALANRCHQVGLYTDWEYRSVATDIARHGYRISEPRPIKRETSQILGKALQYLREDGISRVSAADQLNMGVADLETLMFGLTITSVPGGRSDQVMGESADGRPKWKVIEGA